jgi:hypothetical protein
MATANVTPEVSEPEPTITLTIADEGIYGTGACGDEAWKETSLPPRAQVVVAEMQRAVYALSAVNTILDRDQTHAEDAQDNSGIQYKPLGHNITAGLREARKCLLDQVMYNLDRTYGILRVERNGKPA